MTKTQEPVAWAVYDKRGGSKSLHWPEQHSPNGDATMFDAIPLMQQRPWVGLTDEEMESIFLQCRGEWNGDYWKIEDANFHPFLRTIEAKLKEKNCG